MTYKLLIVSADRTILSWKTLNAKRKAIIDALNKTQNGTWEVEIRYQDVKPVVTNSRIDPKWYDTFSHPLFMAGNHFIYIHFSMKQWEELGLDRGIRGANQKDTDYVGESYGRGDEKTLRGRTKQNQFIQNVLHEMSHELARTTKTADLTHKYHDATPDISGIFASYDMTKWQPLAQKQLGMIALLQKKIADLLKKKPSLVHPVPERFRRITQGYGVRNTLYKITKHHIGIDYGTPVGTPVYAPVSGEIVHSGQTPVLGNFVHYSFVWKGKQYVMRIAHLSDTKPVGKYKAGDDIGYTGNTGI